MTKVPERQLSYGEVLEKLRKLQKTKSETPGTKHFATYRFQEMPTGSKNGAVKITKPSTLPHPLKCSKCNYIASSVADSRQHWALEH